ncbi:MAG: hydrogenase iron-sulfur subunit [Bryobacteraceae bacterium]|jgi:F420-non-reducing hydrogenase iron-sulfur subunit
MKPDAGAIGVQPRGAHEHAPPQPAITVFLCANCARPARAATSAGHQRPVVPDFGWPWPVRQALVPCTGRLQPEHVLKAFESGSEAVCMVACQDDNCHHLEGSKRCARRAAFLRSILEEVGLGGGRLMLFHLPGTAAEDMALGSGRTVEALATAAADAQAAAIRDLVVGALRDLPPSPLNKAPVAGADDNSHQEVELGNDDNEQ